MSNNLLFQPGAAIFNNLTDSLIIRCAEGSVLNVGQVKSDRKRLMTAKDWWNGLQGGGGFIVLGLPKTELGVFVASRQSANQRPLATSQVLVLPVQIQEHFLSLSIFK